MQLHKSIDDLSALPGPVALAIGVFDGVHLGHQAVIEAALEHSAHHGGTAVVMTFDPHPMRVLRPESAPALLCSARHKLLLLERLGVEHTLVCAFDAVMARTNAESFVGRLAAASRPLGFISVGYAWSFGRGGTGDIHKLMELGKEHSFGVYGVPDIKVDGTVVSSTRIREAVRQGDFEHARRCLGRDYTVLGEVVEGRKLGRELGFPTANVAVENEELPPSGVYVVEALLNGERHPGVANLGWRPTVEGEERALEVHLLDFSGDLYGSFLEVAFMKRLRDEKKFPGLDTLKEQIGRDVSEARAYWANAGRR